MIRRALLIIILFTSFFSTHLLGSNFNELRKEYIKALKNYELAPDVYDLFLSVKKPSAQVLAYRGALEAIMTKTTWNVFKKLNYLNKSKSSFDRAIALEPENIEIRFMRMAVQYEIPSYLGFSEDLENDRNFIIAHIDEFNPNGLSDWTINQIFGFMKKCAYFSQDQINRFKGILALK